MNKSRLPTFTAGLLAAAIGLLWIGQGTGIFPYPASSFMVGQMQWTWYGLVLMLAGLAIIVVSQRSNR